MTQRDSLTGLLYGASAYIFWGLVPLYWRQLEALPALELTAHRVVWCALFVGVILAVRGDLGATLKALRNPRLFATLFATGTLLCINWAVYIWSIETDQLVEASLGYYINPLFSIALGVVLLREHMSPLRRFAVELACVAVLVQTLALGHFPFIALTLALSFGLYGYLRKTAAIEALPGVFAEAALIAPFALLFLLYRARTGVTPLLPGDPWRDVLLLLSGPITALPLTLFAAGARRLRLSTMGFVQYLSPTITLLLAVFLFGELFTWLNAATFGCVWAALALLALEAAPARFRWARGAARQKS
jgi:chloramphenicol-sensitive protein RarD